MIPQPVEMLGLRATAKYELGEIDLGHGYLAILEESSEYIADDSALQRTLAAQAIAATARIAGKDRDIELANHLAATVVASETKHPSGKMGAHSALALLAVIEEDSTSAEGEYGYIEPWRGNLIMGAGVSSVDNLLGLLTRTMGKLDDAQTHFEDALAFCRKVGFRPELAWTCCDYGDMLLERDAEGDRAKAITLLDESLAISSELGMRPLMERVLSRREILKA